MRIAVVGAGGVGGLLAAMLARAGEEVRVVARGAALDAIRRDGLRVEGPEGGFTARVAVASDDPGALGPADAVLVSVTAWQVAELAPRLAPLVAGGGVAVPLQNGVEAAERLAAALGPERVADGVIHVLAWLEGPGVIRKGALKPRVTLGERGEAAGRPSARLSALAESLERAGVDARVVDDVARASWEKLMFIDPVGAVGTAARAPIGVIRSVPETRALLTAAVEEVAAVARARGVAVPASAVAATLAFVDSVPAEGTVSMQRDLAAGLPSELDDQAGAVLRLGRAAGVPVPVHEALYAALAPQERAARGAIARFART